MTKREFAEIIVGNYLLNKKIVLVNIGTHKYIGDSFGPLLGSMLKNQLKVIEIYGNLDDTINGTNLLSKINFINEKHKNDLIIGIDSAFSENEEELNKDFILSDKPFRPGLGIGKIHYPEVGQMSIKFCIKQEHTDVYKSLEIPTIKEIYNRTKKAAEFLFDLDEQLNEMNSNYYINRQEVK